MSTVKGSGKRQVQDSEALRSVKKVKDEEDLDLDLFSDIKGIISALHQIKDKAQKDGQKKNEETISSVASEINSMLDDAKSKFEKDRQSFVKSLSKSWKECESSMKDEIAKFQSLYDKFCKEITAHLQTSEDLISKYEDEKKKLLIRYEQQRKREKTVLSELEKTCIDKIAALEDSLKKKKQGDKCFNMLKKSLGSFLESGSDEDFAPDD